MRASAAKYAICVPRSPRSVSSLPGTLFIAAPPLNSLSASAKCAMASLAGPGLRSWTTILDLVSGPHCGGRLAPFFFLPSPSLPFLLGVGGDARRAGRAGAGQLDASAVDAGHRARLLPQNLAQLDVRDHLTIDAALRAPALQVFREVLLQTGPVFLLLEDLRLAEVHARRLVHELVAAAVELGEHGGVVDRLLVLAQTAAEERRRVERHRGVLLTRVLGRELLVVVGGRLVDADVLEVAADEIDGLLGQRRVGLDLDQLRARLDGETDQLGLLEQRSRVVVDLVDLGVVGILGGQLNVEIGRRLGLVGLLQLFDVETDGADLQHAELLLELRIFFDQLGRVEEHVDDAFQVAELLLHAQAVEVEVGRVDRQIAVLMVLGTMIAFEEAAPPSLKWLAS